MRESAIIARQRIKEYTERVNALQASNPSLERPLPVYDDFGLLETDSDDDDYDPSIDDDEIDDDDDEIDDNDEEDDDEEDNADEDGDTQ
jgi:hypothetical protein